MPRLSFEHLDSTGFEQFCFELLHELKFVNIDWRKGTGRSSSPADKGRDIVSQLLRTDIDGTRHFETWFVDCKHFSKGVPPKELQNLLAWSQAERPHTSLFVVSGFLSNGAKDYLSQYKSNNKPSFRIKCWERPDLERLTRRHITLLRKFDLTDSPIRSIRQILKAEGELFHKRWYDRHVMLAERVKEGRDRVDPQIWRDARGAARKIEKKYGKKNLGPWSDFEWGMLAGKHSAIRWVLGDEWDMLDT